MREATKLLSPMPPAMPGERIASALQTAQGGERGPIPVAAGHHEQGDRRALMPLKSLQGAFAPSVASLASDHELKSTLAAA